MDTKHKFIDLYPLDIQIGEVGVEVEVEGDNLGDVHEAMLNKEYGKWVMKSDGSLRGPNAEWVLRRPLNYDDACQAVDMLYKTCDETKGAKFKPSKRCGVHIHINVQQMTMKQIFNFICLYLLFENVLIRWAGAHREGNLFCLRASDAEFLLAQMSQCWSQGMLENIYPDQVRYAALNIGALFTYGSLEFRSLPTPKFPGRINTWMRMLLALKEASMKYRTPKEIIIQYGAVGPDKLMTSTFGSLAPIHAIPDKSKLMKQGLRNLQDVLALEPRPRGKTFGLGSGWNPGDGVGPALNPSHTVGNPFADAVAEDYDDIEEEEAEGYYDEF